MMNNEKLHPGVVIGMLLIVAGILAQNLSSAGWLAIAGSIAAICGAVVVTFSFLSGFINAHFRAWNVSYWISKYPPQPDKREHSWRYRVEPGIHTLCLRMIPRTTVTLGEVEVRFTERYKYWPLKWRPAPRNKVEVLWATDVDFYERIPHSIGNGLPYSDESGGMKVPYSEYVRDGGDSIWLYVVVSAKEPWAGRLHCKAGLYGQKRYARQTFAVTRIGGCKLQRLQQRLAYGSVKHSVHPGLKDGDGRWLVIKSDQIQQL